MIKAIDAVVVLHTPEVVQGFPPVWFEQPAGPKEAVGLDAQIAYKGLPLADLIAQMDQGEVEKALLHAPNMGPWGIRRPPEAVARAVDEYPDRLIAGAVGMNPHEGMKGVRELERCVEQYGFKAMHLHPHWLERPANDAMYYPYYAKCVELDIPVLLQIRMPSQYFLRSHGRPQYIEDIAAYFPELRIVGLHVGWPWLEEFMALLIKHPNFYMTTSAFPTADWDPRFVNFVNTQGQDKIIFGTASPIARGGSPVALAGIRKHSLDSGVLTKILRENAIQVFKLGGGSGSAFS